MRSAPPAADGPDPSLRLDAGVTQTPDEPALDGGVPSLPDPAQPDSGEPVATDSGLPDSGTATPDAGTVPAPDSGTSPAPDSGGPSTPDSGGPGRECYSEPFDPTVDISDLERDYRAGARPALATIVEALGRRYPAGADILIEERNDPYTGSFIDRSSFGSVMESSMTEVHEATHGWDYRHALFRQYFGYWLRGDLQHRLTFDVDIFARSRIRPLLEDSSTSLYAGTYLTGEQGTRGLIELLDEMNCYINGLGAIAAIAEEVPYGISGRDGAVAFLYYLQRYLFLARTEYPADYARMQADTALTEHVKTQWLRTHFFLMFADQVPRVGIHDDEIRDNLYAPANLSEISTLIGRCVDQTNCLCD